MPLLHTAPRSVFEKSRPHRRRLERAEGEGDYSRYSEKERAALTYAEKLTRTPHDIGDGDVATLSKHFSEPEIVDIHLLTGLANLTNRFTDPLGLEVEFPEEKV